MTKHAKKRPTTEPTVSPSRRRSSPKKAEKDHPAARSGTKQSAAIAMLRSRDGASIAALTKATGWQQHSVRGFLAGVVRKRLKLDLESDVINGVRTYRIIGDRSRATETQSAGQKS